MDKKSVIITGAASGIGRATAIKFSKMGYFVGAFDVNIEGLISLQNEVGPSLVYFVCDVTSDESVKNAITQFTVLTEGSLDVLCSNAGILVQKPFIDGDLKMYKKMIDINDYGMVNVIYQALPYLKNTKNSRIVITSSSSASFGMPLFSVYSATKLFLRGLTEALYNEFRAYKIHVSDVMPLFVKSGMTKDQNDARFVKASTQTPALISKYIYKAATKSKKRHHRIGFQVHLMNFLSRFLSVRAFEWFLRVYLKIK
jgi:short-subunit dehydrogenase